MKHYISVVMMTILSVMSVFASSSFNGSCFSKEEAIKDIYRKTDPKVVAVDEIDWSFKTYKFDDNYDYVEHDLQKIAEEMVPEEYLDTFNHYTEMGTLEETINMRIHILSLGLVESEWTAIVSDKNKNGTYDIGYLQLNSANRKNDLFLWKFAPKKSDNFNYDKSDEMEYCMIMCIKFYKALYKLYGNDACYCYNAGEGNYLNNTIPASTIRYQRKISVAISNIAEALEKQKEHRRRDELNTQLCDIVHTTDVIQMTEAVLLKNRSYYPTQTAFQKSSDAVLLFDRKRLLATQNAIISLNIQVVINPDYVYVGEYMKNTGAKAPVFLHKPTGKTVYC